MVVEGAVALAVLKPIQGWLGARGEDVGGCFRRTQQLNVQNRRFGASWRTGGLLPDPEMGTGNCPQNGGQKQPPNLGRFLGLAKVAATVGTTSAAGGSRGGWGPDLGGQFWTARACPGHFPPLGRAGGAGAAVAASGAGADARGVGAGADVCCVCVCVWVLCGLES